MMIWKRYKVGVTGRSRTPRTPPRRTPPMRFRFRSIANAPCYAF